MPDALAAALAQEGLGWLLLTVFAAGLVRGFSGFGTAMIFVPVAARFMEPVWVLISLTVMDLFGPLPNLPRAWRDGRPRDVGLMVLTTLAALPLGLATLLAVPAEVFRYAVSILAVLVPVLLVLGLRYRGPLSRSVLLGTGAAAGLSGGAAGLPGPPVVLLYASSTRPVAEIRANILMFLLAFDVVLMGLLGLKGQLTLMPILLGLVFVLPGVAGNMLGGAIFDPARERMYRGVAYTVVLTAAVSGLPIWD